MWLHCDKLLTSCSEGIFYFLWPAVLRAFIRTWAMLSRAAPIARQDRPSRGRGETHPPSRETRPADTSAGNCYPNAATQYTLEIRPAALTCDPRQDEVCS